MKACAKGEAERRPKWLKPLGGAPKGGGRATWPLRALVAPSSGSKAHLASFGEKLAYYFSLNLFPAKIARTKTLLKIASDSAVFIQVWGILGQNIEKRAW